MYSRPITLLFYVLSCRHGTSANEIDHASTELICAFDTPLSARDQGLPANDDPNCSRRDLDNNLVLELSIITAPLRDANLPRFVVFH